MNKNDITRRFSCIDRCYPVLQLFAAGFMLMWHASLWVPPWLLLTLINEQRKQQRKHPPSEPLTRVLVRPRPPKVVDQQTVAYPAVTNVNQG